MHVGHNEDSEGWGEGSPVKLGLIVEWDSIAFWRIVPHKHVPEPGRSFWPEEMIVNLRCDKCLRWYVKATGKLNKELNERE